MWWQKSHDGIGRCCREYWQDFFFFKGGGRKAVTTVFWETSLTWEAILSLEAQMAWVPLLNQDRVYTGVSFTKHILKFYWGSINDSYSQEMSCVQHLRNQFQTQLTSRNPTTKGKWCLRSLRTKKKKEKEHSNLLLKTRCSESLIAEWMQWKGHWKIKSQHSRGQHHKSIGRTCGRSSGEEIIHLGCPWD